MVSCRVRLSFLAAVCGGLVGGAGVARAEPMGDLGGAERLVVRGLETTLAASLRQGLLDDGRLYWLGIPSADREPYLTPLRTRIPLALEAAGFAEPRVTVEVGPGPDGKESVLIDVAAGSRLTAGPIRVTGIPADMAARLVKHLQEPQPPGDAVPETITLPDGTEKVLWFDAQGEPAKLGSPAWTPGEPARCGQRCASDLLGSVAGLRKNMAPPAYGLNVAPQDIGSMPVNVNPSIKNVAPGLELRTHLNLEIHERNSCSRFSEGLQL